MIAYEGNKLEDLITKYLDVYKKKEVNKEELEKILQTALKQIEPLDPDDIPDSAVENILKTLMAKKFTGDSAIDLTMISGLLAMPLPEHFAVIDTFVLEGIYKLKDKQFYPKELKSLVLKKWQSMKGKDGKAKKITSKDYINYLKIVKGNKKSISEGASGRNFSLSDIDRALYAYKKHSR